MGLLFMGCECKVPFELCCAIDTVADKLVVQSLVRDEAGDPVSSVGQLEFGTAVSSLATVTSSNARLNMTREEWLLSVTHGVATNTVLYQCHDVNTGDIEWEHTRVFNPAITTDSYGTQFRLNGIPITGFANTDACCGDGVLFEIRNRRLHDASGYVEGFTGTVTAGNPDLGAGSAVWVPRMLASHDYPKCLGVKFYFENYFETYDGSEHLGSGLYRHFYTTECDSVVKIGIGDFGRVNGDMSGVTEVREHICRVRKEFFILGTVDNPRPEGHTISVVCNDASVSVIGFSSIGSRSTYAYTVTHDIGGTSGPSYTMSYSGGRRSGEYLVAGGVDVYERDVTLTPRMIQLATVHDTPTGAGFARYLTVERKDIDAGSPSNEYWLRGYSSAGVLLWEQESLDSDGIDKVSILSVNDTWALVYFRLDQTVTLAPDGRDWSNLNMGSGVDIRYWMVRLDNEEWEPCRQPGTTPPWQANGNGMMDYSTTPIPTSKLTFDRDLIKSAEHPFGPPEDTYGTTPP